MSDLRIGFDAKRAFVNTTGLGNYSRTLIESLTEFTPDVSFQLFTPRLGQFHEWAQSLPNTDIRQPGPISRFFPSLWRRTYGPAILRHRLDIFHGLSHEIPWGWRPGRTRFVVTIHDLIFLRYPHFYRRADRWSYFVKIRHSCQVADQIVAISYQTRADIAHYMEVPEEKIKVIYQSVQPVFQNPTPQSRPVGREKPYVLYVGSLGDRKNIFHLLQAWSRIPQKKDTQLVLIGNAQSKTRRELQRRAASLGLDFQRHLCHLPDIPTEQLPAYYQHARFTVYPSLFEGFGLPIVESLSQGTPVLTSQGSCFHEAGGPGALYADPNQPEDIAKNLEILLEDKALRSELRLRGKEYIRRFEPKSIAADWLNTYRALL